MDVSFLIAPQVIHAPHDARPTRLNGQSMPELLHETPPERVRFPDVWIAGLFSDSRVNQD